MISDYANQLRNWENWDDYNGLRDLLGNILHTVNQNSIRYKSIVRNPSPENISDAHSLLSDIEDFEKIQILLPEVEENIKDKTSTATMLKTLIHTIKNSSFSSQQIQQLQSIATSNGKITSQDFPEETNKVGLDNHLKNSIYNTGNSEQRTLKVIREILQNAVDATDVKQHPDLKYRPNYKPEIFVTTDEYDDKDYMDVMIHDKGIGMNWDVLSKKFFVTFESGKKDSPDAAGGFGIAKALIQEAPKHGWSIDTGSNIHSNRFQKNIYFGTRQDGTYNYPESKITKDTDGGTILTLFGLPKAWRHYISQLCEVYATNGKVDIFFNNRNTPVVPKFTLKSADVKSLDDINILPDIVGTGVAEKEIASSVFVKFQDKISEKINIVNTLALQNPIDKTEVKFYIRKTDMSGKLYVMLNGQYQFDSQEYINKIDVICSISTKARPGSDGYPLDPGRSMVRGKIGETIKAIITDIKSFTEKVTSDDLFKEGIDEFMVNKDFQPMSTFLDGNEKEKRQKLTLALHADLSAAMEDSENESSEDLVNKLINTFEIKTNRKVSDIQQSVVKELIADMVGDINNRFTSKERDEKLQAIIEGLTTPANIMIQKNFIGRSQINNNIALTAEIMILWQKTLKLIMDKMGNSKVFKNSFDKKFIPGLIYSDEVLGLYTPPKEDIGRKYSTISINPLILASAINPQKFEEKLSSQKEKKAFENLPEEESLKSGSADTPINRLAKFMFHIGVHEMCHLLYPDGSWGHENFHNNITYMEIYCHDVYDEIRKEAKPYMGAIRRKSAQLITIISKHKKKEAKQNETTTGEPVVREFSKQKKIVGFYDWLSNANKM